MKFDSIIIATDQLERGRCSQKIDLIQNFELPKVKAALDMMISVFTKIGLIYVASAHELMHNTYPHSSHSHDIDVNHEVLTILRRLFPLNARYNSILATCYISFIPCLLVMLLPGFRRASTKMMGLMVPFALGSMIGDILLHIIPELYTSGKDTIHVANGIFAGFVGFMLLDKGFRIAHPRLETGDFHGHHHSHGNIEVSPEQTPDRKVSDFKNKEDNQSSVGLGREENNSLRISSYLNMFFEFIHKITDGIALSSAFYSSTHMGILSFIAILLHEVPHELCDFALKISGGLTFKKALATEICTSIGSLIGAVVGCALNELNNPFAAGENDSTRVTDMVFTITCGGLLYSGTVGVVPQILQPKDNSQWNEVLFTLIQFTCILLGYYLMRLLD